MKLTLLSVIIIGFVALAFAGEGVTVDKGRALFTSARLGSNGSSCDSCHPSGKGLSRAATYEPGKLGQIINKCIKSALNGDALDPDSTEMKAIILYIKSFAPSSRN